MLQRITLLCAVLLTLATGVNAQEAPAGRAYNGGYYAFFSTGACHHGYASYGVGGGAEVLVWKGLTVGAEASINRFSDGWTFGFGTLQGGYHFRGKTRAAKWDPFASYGVGFASTRGRFGPAGNLGGGTTYWFKDRVGLRLEGRIAGFSREALATFRAGVSFR